MGVTPYGPKLNSSWYIWVDIILLFCIIFPTINGTICAQINSNVLKNIRIQNLNS